MPLLTTMSTHSTLLPLLPLHLFSGGKSRRPGAGRPKQSDKLLPFLLSIIIVFTGVFVYFGAAVGSGMIDFVNLKVQIESTTYSIDTKYGLISHEIVGIGQGFNGFTLTGKVRAKQDVTEGGIWLAAKVSISGVCDVCDWTGCNRPTYLGPSFSIPQGYYLLVPISGMKAGETKDFSFSLTKDDILKWTYSQSFAFGNPLTVQTPSGTQPLGFEGKVILAIVDTQEKVPQKTTEKYLVCAYPCPYRTFITKEALKFRFQYKWDQLQTQSLLGFRNIIVGDENAVKVKEMSTVDIHGQGILLEMKITLTAALLIFALPALLLIYRAVMGGSSRKGSSSKSGLLNLRTIAVLILFFILGSILWIIFG